jgi:cytochrome oxidase Cu insertion factor (SCO1/SenC/PrrC family)
MQTQAAQTWSAGAKAAPGFALRDDGGRPISLARFRSRPVLLTFMDPVCTDFCPREAAILDRAVALLPASRRPAIVAVSVNEFEQSRPILRRDRAKWKMNSSWHWAVGAPTLEKKVWHAYGIGVLDSPTTKNGKVEHEITHTEATYVIDAHGDQRAVFLYPFRAADVAKTLRSLD